MTVTKLPAAIYPTNFEGTVYSNFDHSYDPEVVEALKTPDGYLAQHAAYNYCGYVWLSEGLYHESVLVYGEVVATYTSADLKELIEHVISEHGAD